MTPAFSVIVPCRDRPRLLRRALASLDRQSFRDFETVVVDDGSAEDLAPVLAAFPRLGSRLVRTGPMGANHARNVGTADARGPLVAYLDSDDAFLPEKLAHAARCAAADPAIDLFAGGGYVRRADGSLKLRPSRPIAPNEDISDFYFAAGQRFLTSSLVVRTTAARAVRWDEGLSKVQDPDFVIRLVRAGYRLDYEPTPGVVLFDDIQAGRISNSIALDNMIDWLARSGHYLTPRARAGFEVYALASEAARLSRRSELAHLARAATRAPWRLTAKSLYRIVVPAAAFKATARLSPGTRRSRELAEFLRNLDPAALEPPVAS